MQNKHENNYFIDLILEVMRYLHRDSLEIKNLQSSSTLKQFVEKSIQRYNNTLIKSISYKNKYNIINTLSELDNATNCLILSIDNILNFSYGALEYGFAIMLFHEQECYKTFICIPFLNTVILADKYDGVRLINAHNNISKIRLCYSPNIIMNRCVILTDNNSYIQNHNKLMQYFKIKLYILISESPIYDLFKLLTSRADIILYNSLSLELITLYKFIIKEAGGEILADEKIICGKSIAVKSTKLAII